MTKKRRLSPKIDALAGSHALVGSLQPEHKRCGKPTCRCAIGELHGPYWRRYWREGGRRRRAYVRAADLERVRAGLAEWRRLHPPARSARDVLMELRLLFRQLDTMGM
jgi:Family of unknown function (DUF6788)